MSRCKLVVSSLVSYERFLLALNVVKVLLVSTIKLLNQAVEGELS
jgi:hypothetical protein